MWRVHAVREPPADLLVPGTESPDCGPLAAVEALRLNRRRHGCCTATSEGDRMKKHTSKLRKPTPPSGPDGKNRTKGRQPMLPSYDEGHVESVGEGRGQGRDEDPRTGQGSGRRTEREQQPKGAVPRDRFMSSEVAAEAGTQKTTG